MKSLSETPNGIRERLAEMYRLDQEMRDHAHLDPSKWDDALAVKNTLGLKEIILEIGWPSISKVGEFGATCAWLIAQHSDHDIPFQKECLALMKSEPTGAVKKRNIAFLEDRIAVAEDRPQKYGTQFQRSPNCHSEVCTLLDRDQIEVFRAEVGLEPFAEYEAMMTKFKQ